MRRRLREEEQTERGTCAPCRGMRYIPAGCDKLPSRPLCLEEQELGKQKMKMMSSKDKQSDHVGDCRNENIFPSKWEIHLRVSIANQQESGLCFLEDQF